MKWVAQVHVADKWQWQDLNLYLPLESVSTLFTPYRSPKTKPENRAKKYDNDFCLFFLHQVDYNFLKGKEWTIKLPNKIFLQVLIITIVTYYDWY